MVSCPVSVRPANMPKNLGINDAMLPYLMRYMGHSSLESTYYYIHLIPDFFPMYQEMAVPTEELLPEVDINEI